MTTEEIIIHIFCLVDDWMPEIEKHPQAKLYPSELLTIGILFALIRRSVCGFAPPYPSVALVEDASGVV